MSYSLDYLPFQMCPCFELRRTSASNQWHTRLSQHPAAFEGAQHLVLSLCWCHKWSFLPPLLCDSTWPTGRELMRLMRLMRHWPWWGWARDPEALLPPHSAVVSFWIITLSKIIFSAPKAETLRCFSFLTRAKLVSPPDFWGVEFTETPGSIYHSVLNKFPISCWRRCSPGAVCGDDKIQSKQPREDAGAHPCLESQGLENPQHLHRSPWWCPQAEPEMPLTRQNPISWGIFHISFQLSKCSVWVCN